MDCSDMKRGSATDWLMAVNPLGTAVCWQGWQLHTLGGWNSRLASGGATENADFLSLESFSKSLALVSRGFFPMRESTLKADEFCMLGCEWPVRSLQRMCLLCYEGRASLVYMDRKLKESFYRYDVILHALLFTDPEDNKYRLLFREFIC